MTTVQGAVPLVCDAAAAVTDMDAAAVVAVTDTAVADVADARLMIRMSGLGRSRPLQDDVITRTASK